jgi:hypothetical protein
MTFQIVPRFLPPHSRRQAARAAHAQLERMAFAGIGPYPSRCGYNTGREHGPLPQASPVEAAA